MAVLLLDNYEDLMKNQTENQRSTIYAEVNARLDAWVAGTGGMLRRMERDRYLLLFEEQYLSRFVDQKFDIRTPSTRWSIPAAWRRPCPSASARTAAASRS